MQLSAFHPFPIVTDVLSSAISSSAFQLPKKAGHRVLPWLLRSSSSPPIVRCPLVNLLWYLLNDVIPGRNDHLLPQLGIWTTTANSSGRAKWETSTTNKTCRRCHRSDDRSTRNNTNNWKGRRWSLKLKLISIFILTHYRTLGAVSFLEELAKKRFCQGVADQTKLKRVAEYTRNCGSSLQVEASPLAFEISLFKLIPGVWNRWFNAAFTRALK